MTLLYDLLYQISAAFLIPAVLGVVLVFAYACLLSGEFLSDWLDHRANQRSLRRYVEGSLDRRNFPQDGWRGPWRQFQQELRYWETEPRRVEKFLADLEHDLLDKIERLAITARLAPILGLIGTLIPLQPALAGLARGDMQSMGLNLQIGFTTTVLGLLAGGAGFLIAVFRRSWARRTLNDMHFLLDCWKEAELNELAGISETLEGQCDEPDGAAQRVEFS
ncbi:MAG: membrane protein [Bryobacteraceae bacterium]|nr:MAG: membrane protein [Bryobacteraceae bacterium]